MKSLTRTIIVLVVFNLAMGSFALAQAEGLAEPTARRRGRSPIPLKLPVTPVEPTQTTLPVSKSSFTISGSTGLGGVTMHGLPGNPVTDTRGYYIATVKHGWSGKVIPVKEGFSFEPEGTIYSKVNTSRSSDNYTSKLITYTISGEVGVGGVEMRGLPGNVVTDPRGYYSATVKHGWRGRVMPVKEGFNFEPASMTYTKVTTSRSNDNYTSKLITLTISGEVGVGGVEMRGLPGNPVTGRNGTYQATVNYGWTGTVKPTKEGYAFEPHNLQYSRVKRDQTNQSYNPKRLGPAPMLGRTGGRKVLVIPDSDVKPEELDAITQDLQVMSYILDEKFKEIREDEGLFVDFGDFFRRDSRDTEAIYLDGYGALFLMEVNFAFTPPPKAQEQELEETAEDVDPTWQRARQKMFSPEEPMMGRMRRIRSRKGDGAVRLKQLSTELIKTLKHAANIRNLKQDEWVIFTVFGKSRQYGGLYEDYYRSAAPRSRISGRRRSSSSEGGGLAGGFGGSYSAAGGSVSYPGGYASSSAGGYGGGMMGGGMMGAMEYGEFGMEYGETGSNSLTAMTVRAKKSDVDAFAKGELDFEQFQQKVQHFVMY